MFEDLQNKRVLVTGSSSGIGAGIAQGFAAQGARVVIHYNGNQTGAQATADAISGDTLVLKADLSQESEAESLLTEIEQAWGGFDILVNNAGVVP